MFIVFTSDKSLYGVLCTEYVLNTLNALDTLDMLGYAGCAGLDTDFTDSNTQSFKEELQHVDQWFRFLSETERTTTVYALLQHSSQVQIRFFISVLQQLLKRDPANAFLTPASTDQGKEEKHLEWRQPIEMWTY